MFLSFEVFLIVTQITPGDNLGNMKTRLIFRRSSGVLYTVSELCNLAGLQLQLELVRDEGDELRIGGLAFRIGNRVSEEPLEGVQVAPVPGYLDGVADGPLHTAGGGLEGFRHLGVQDLGDGIRVPDGPRRGYHGEAWEPYKE